MQTLTKGWPIETDSETLKRIGFSQMLTMARLMRRGEHPIGWHIVRNVLMGISMAYVKILCHKWEDSDGL